MGCGEATIAGRLHKTACRSCHHNLSSFEEVVGGDRYESSDRSREAFVDRVDGTDDAGSLFGGHHRQ